MGITHSPVCTHGQGGGNLMMFPHMGADFFPEWGKNTSKLVVPPQNGSRGGDTFPLCWGGVGGGKGGKPNFKGGNWDSYENKSKKQEGFFNKIWVRSLRAKITKERYFFQKTHFPPFLARNFFEGP